MYTRESTSTIDTQGGHMQYFQSGTTPHTTSVYWREQLPTKLIEHLRIAACADDDAML